MRTQDGDEAAERAGAGPVLAVDKALAVVELLMRDGAALSARELAARLGLNRTTVHRLLNALAHRGWVEKPSGTRRYRLSLRFLALAHVATQSRRFLGEVRPTLEELARLSRETVHLGVLDGFEVVHVDKVESLERVGVSSQVGSRGVLHTTGLGKALLAASPDAVLDAYLAARARDPGEAPVADPTWLRAEIARTRARGYSLDDEEDSVGVRCLGVAVRGADGAPICALSITGPSPRFTRAKAAALAPAVVAAGRALSRRFGWEDPAGAPAAAGQASAAPPPGAAAGHTRGEERTWA